MYVTCPTLCSRHTGSRTRGIQRYYRRQERYLECVCEDDAVLADLPDPEAESPDEIAWDDHLTKATLLVNVVMLGLKILAAYWSHSMSIISTVVDSFMDISAGSIIWVTMRSMDKADARDYPTGNNRLENVAVLLVSMVMIFANFMVIYESGNACIENTLDPGVNYFTMGILIFGTAIKTVLYILCRRQKTTPCQVLAQDQLNDMITNVTALLGAYIGHRYWVYADPIGAFCVAGFIIVNWVRTAKEQIPLLIGQSASPELVDRISRIATAHDDRIHAIDMVYAYHMGDKFLVELHVVMDGDLSLRDSHDVSETLQTQIEKLPFVQRCFVHSDYELDGDEHLKKFN
uniref:ZT_dimer domain-containing protein n=1 Tax=Panagrellus redivivus TaxID=6233 RepID=A0A7E4ZSU8_PANRE